MQPPSSGARMHEHFSNPTAMGFAAGILNVIRVVAEMNAASPPPPGSDLGPDVEDEERGEN